MQNRPRVYPQGAGSPQTVLLDIASRRVGATRDSGFGYTQRSEPSAWKDNIVVARNGVHVSRKPIGPPASGGPGPKYVFDMGNSGRCAPFSTADRFRRGETCRDKTRVFSSLTCPAGEETCSPGPVFFPPHPTGPLSQNRMGAVSIDTAGRGLYNSIYYDRSAIACHDSCLHQARIINVHVHVYC